MRNYKVKINVNTESIEEKVIITVMPFIPKIGDLIGCWVNGDWESFVVKYIVHEFDESNKFILTELNC